MPTTATLWGNQIAVSNNFASSNSSITALKQGGFAIVYNETLTSSSHSIVGEIFDELGNSNNSNFISSTTSTLRNYGAPSVVQLEGGSIAVGYSVEYSLDDYDIEASVFYGGQGGRPLVGSAFPIDTSFSNDYFVYNIKPSDNGNYYILWAREGVNNSEQIVLQQASPNGFIVGSQIIIDGGFGESQDQGELTVLNNGNIVVTWRSIDSSFSTSLRMGIFSADGSPIRSSFEFGSTSNPAFATTEALSNGNYVVAWQDVTDGGIYHQIYNANGNALNFASFYPAGFSILPKVSAVDSGGYLLAWSDFNNVEGDGSPDGSITIQRFDQFGVALGAPLIIDNPGDQSLQDMQTLSDGRVVLTFDNETGDSTNASELTYQIIDPRENIIYGTEFNDNIVGRMGASTIFGRNGDDRITGLTRNDRLDGGRGADIIFGGSGEDTLNGGSENDTLNGGSGLDRLIGGVGNDHYIVTTGDIIIERAGQGTDVVQSFNDWTLSSNVENLTLTGVAGVNGTGNSLANTLIGNIGNNILRGEAGNDRLLGGDNRDQLLGGDDHDHLAGGSGDDKLWGGKGNDRLNGDKGWDEIHADRGFDVLAGGKGRDHLYGGLDASADIFVFASHLDSEVGSRRDVIFNFTRGSDDIDLGKIDAVLATSGRNDIFEWSGNVRAEHSVWWTRADDFKVLLKGDIDGDGRADFEIMLVGLRSLSVEDVIL